MTRTPEDRATLLPPRRKLHPFREVISPPPLASSSAALSSLTTTLSSFLGDALSSLRRARLLEGLVRYDEAGGGAGGKWVFAYTWEKLARDAIASTVIASLLVPQSMSYALLLGVPVQYGLYSAVVRALPPSVDPATRAAAH